MELRYYQEASIAAVLAYWGAGGMNPLVDLATGTGKSVVIAELIKRILEMYPLMRIVVFAHVKELVDQNSQELIKQWPQAIQHVGINCAGLGRRDWRQRVIFASIDSVYQTPNLLGDRDLVLIDEAHMIPKEGAGKYRSTLQVLRDRVPDMRVLGLTATPYRLGSGRLDEGNDRLFDETIYTYGIAQGVSDGFLAPLIGKGTALKLNLKGVAKSGGEYKPGALEKAVDTDEITKAAVAEILEWGLDPDRPRKSWLVFCCGVAHSDHVRDAFRAHGITAESVTSKTEDGDRTQIFKDYKAGKIQVLTGMNVFTTGFNANAVDMIAMLRPTLSTSLYVQMLGRGTRCVGPDIQASIANGKSDCLVLDFTNNIRSHGPVDDIQIREKGAKEGGAGAAVKEDDVRAKECPSCKTLIHVSASICKHCDYHYPPPEIVVTHLPTADDESVLLTAQMTETWLKVEATAYEHNKGKEGKTDTLRAEYWVGVKRYCEWHCVLHTGYVREKAEVWWKATGGKDELVVGRLPSKEECHAYLGRVTHIMVRKDGEFWRIIKRRILIDDVLYEADEKMRRRQLGETELEGIDISETEVVEPGVIFDTPAEDFGDMYLPSSPRALPAPERKSNPYRQTFRGKELPADWIGINDTDLDIPF